MNKKPIRVVDYQLIRWECYNPNAFDVIFTLIPSKIPYVASQGIAVGNARVVCKAGGWATLNHSYYMVTASNGADHIDVIRNYGDAIGKGNKLPSAPLEEKHLFKSYGKNNH